jgi:two-component system phosphate regulon sensor histidine kinase PhoR
MRRRLTLAAAGAALAGLAVLAWSLVALPRARARALERERAAIEEVARGLADSLGLEALPPDLPARLRALAAVAGARLTVVGEDDRVLADSAVSDARTMDVHGSRPEVVAARRDGHARLRRRSASLSREMEYAAQPVPGTRVVARAARDARAVDASVADAASLDPLGVLVALLAGAVAAVVVAAPAAAALSSVVSAVRAFGRGDRTARVPVRAPASVRDLVEAWRETSETVGTALDEAEAQRARLAALLDGLPEAVLVVDGDEDVRYVNAAARAMLRLPEGEAAEGRPLHAWIREPHVLTLLRGAVARGESGEAEVAFGEGPTRLVRFHAAPVRGGEPGAFLLARDISALRRLERMRSDFVANVSHELRTPIAAIAGAAETLADGALGDPEAGPRFVDTVRRQADRLRVLVDDLLTLSRLESAREAVERVPVDFSVVARQACEAMGARARDGGVSLEVEAPGPLRVGGDPEALRRLVDNLVLNAVTYTPRGGRVHVRLRPEGGRAVLSVADTGIGIAPEHLDRIFERFYRVDKARSRAKGGTGLGLAIVKHAVALHEGDVRVESRLGRGSTFTASIPLLGEGGASADEGIAGPERA